MQAQNREAVLSEIKEIHETKHKDNYGSPRVQKELASRGVFCSENTVAKLMQRAGIESKTQKKFKVTTDSKHAFETANNVLNREFDRATSPNQLWVSDITYVWTLEGWLYLTAVLDLYSRKVIGWSLSSKMTTEFVQDALHMALKNRCPGKGLLHHSDRGSQYCSNSYQQVLADHKITCSMSRKGNCWDNAAMESFFATLKKELIHRKRYATREEAKQDIFEYIETFYNQSRLHSSVGYLSPEEFERQHKKGGEK